MRRFAMLILVVVAGAFTPDDASSQQCKICDQEWITGYGYIHDFLEWQENSTNCEDAVEGHPVGCDNEVGSHPGPCSRHPECASEEELLAAAFLLENGDPVAAYVARSRYHTFLFEDDDGVSHIRSCAGELLATVRP